MRVLVVMGTRPEVIKMSPVIKRLKQYPTKLTVAVCVTAQHRGMLDQMLATFQIDVDHDLDVMHENQTLSETSVRVLKGMEKIFAHQKIDLILVQGDTTTSLVASLVAFYHRVRVGHVEAGLRTWRRFYPYPEEMNRKLITQLTDIHFAPTKRASENLTRDGVAETSIFVTGNPVIDALLEMLDATEPPRGELFDVLRERETILVTAHRRENFGRPLENICRAIKKIATMYPDYQIVYPVHLNPNIRNVVLPLLGGIKNIHLIPPMDYQSFVHLMKLSYMILSDSGGIQEEAPSLGVPVLVLRDVTERPEAVDAGTVKVIGTSSEAIVEEAVELIENTEAYRKMSRATNPYGDGKASERIAQIILNEAS